jgi:hypothetical protein
MLPKPFTRLAIRLNKPTTGYYISSMENNKRIAVIRKSAYGAAKLSDKGKLSVDTCGGKWYEDAVFEIDKAAFEQWNAENARD